MEKAKLESFKKLFLQLRESGLNLDEELSESFSPVTGGDQVDQLLGDREQQLLLKLKSRESFFIKKVDKALTKISEGTFGDCEDCGECISDQRLMARPTATLCIQCKEEQEWSENQRTYEKRSHTIGREIINENVIQVQFGDRDESKGKTKKTLGIQNANL